MKQYRQDNIDKCKERDKQYYQDNKQKLLEQVKQYQERNKESISQRRTETIMCNLCGCEVKRGNTSTHQKTRKCLSNRTTPSDVSTSVGSEE